MSVIELLADVEIDIVGVELNEIEAVGVEVAEGVGGGV